MDTPTGIKVPATLLPSIDEIRPEDIIVLCIHSANGWHDPTVRNHLDQLMAHLGDQVQWLDAPAFETDSLDVFHQQMRALVSTSRLWGAHAKILVSRFAPRFRMFEEYATVSFHFFPGYEQVNLQRGKLNREVVGPKVLEIPKLARMSELKPLPNTLQINITGNCPRNGKTTLTHLLREFLSERLPDHRIVHRASEAEVAIRGEDRYDEDNIRAEMIELIDGNMRPIPKERVDSIPCRWQNY